MIVGVDAGAISITDERLKVGVWRVTFNLLKELSTLDTVNQYRLYSFRVIERGVMEVFGPRMTNVVLRPAKGWMSVRLPIELKLRPVDVFLGLAQALPHSSSHNIGFIYDLGFLYHPDAYGTSANRLKKQTQELVARADHIVTISQASKKDILHQYGIEKDRVTVSYPGVDEELKDWTPDPSSSAGRQVRNDTNTKHPYFLFVGSLNKAKDIPLAIEAFAMFLKKANKPYDLLLIGGDYWPDPAIDAAIHRYQLNGNIRKLGFVPDEMLLDYYRGATAFVTTALHEGFCLPAAEAMAAGTPVVAVDRGAMKEVVGDGGIIVEERGINSASTNLASALARVAETKTRAALSKQATLRAKTFRWKAFAQTVYQRINILTR